MNTSIIRRRQYQGDSGIKLPSGYTLGQYFNITGYTRSTLSATLKPFDIEMKIRPSDVSSKKHLCGIQINFMLGIATSGKAYCQAGLNSKTTSDDVMFSTSADAVITGKITTASNKCTFFVDGVDTGLKGTSSSYGESLFSLNDAGANQYQGRVYYIKIFKNGELVSHYVPVLGSDPEKTTTQNSKMYDIINDTFMSFAVKNATTVV